MTPLYGHTNPENAYVSNDYPYGRLRCRIKFWIEYNEKKGFRFVSQTENPKTLRWNSPRLATYNAFAACLYLDDNGHVQCSAISEYAKTKEVVKFMENFPEADFSRLKVWVIGRRAICNRTVKGEAILAINGVPQMPSETDIEEAKEELTMLDRCSELLKAQKKC